MRVLKIIAILAIASFLLLIASFYLTQRSLLYFPTRVYLSPAQAHANEAFQELVVTTADNLKLKAWYASAASKPFTIVFFHGNGDSLYGAAPVAEPYIEAGYGFLAVEYRGYSGLPGKPTEAGLYSDGRACIQALIAHGVPPRHPLRPFSRHRRRRPDGQRIPGRRPDVARALSLDTITRPNPLPIPAR